MDAGKPSGAGGRNPVIVEDRRQLGVVVVERAALGRLADRFTGRRLPIARSIYLGLVELATAQVVEVPRAVVAEYSGVSRKALDEYVPELEAAGVLVRERRADGDGGNLPNRWLLVDPDAEGGTQGVQGGHAQRGGHADDPVRPSTHSSSSRAGRRTGGGASVPTPAGVATFEAWWEQEAACISRSDVSDAVAADAQGLLDQRRRVDGRQVTVDEMVKAAAALSAFNVEAGRACGLGAHLTAIVGRIRERPSYDAAMLVRLVRSAWRIQWWERSGRRRGRPSPSVIFGNSRVFEAVVQDAIDEKAGRKVEPEVGGGSRYMRED